MHYDPELAIRRIERFLHQRLTPAIHGNRHPLSVAAWPAPGEPVPFGDAARANFEPLTSGAPWGRPWGTTWLRVTGSIPTEWPESAPFEMLADLGFTGGDPGFQAEGTVYDDQGRVLGGLAPRHRRIRLDGKPGDPVALMIEAASNPDVISGLEFRPTRMGDLDTAGKAPLYRLGSIEVAVFDQQVWELVQDVWSLLGLARELPSELPRRAEILMALERAMDELDPEAVSATAPAARGVLAGVLARPAHASAHEVYAVGHAHIDSAWLWPLREASRKVTRTFSNVLALMDEDPDFVFTASSAQHYAWVKEHHPELFDRIRRRTAEGRFIPTGSMWVESDTNMPGGEAMARQLIVGKRWFIEELDYEPEVVWLPDSFGYSAALPQLVRQAGCRWFLTQKLSWNETNPMPHHTFRWEGIDGTQVFTHFPPVDTYSSDLSAGQLAHAQSRYREKGAANTSLVPFGWGDGGGGPTREMLAAAIRTADLEGSPKVRLSTPEAFFEAAESEYPDPPVWVGELYLEKHRGTYTSQSRTKRGNRRSEHLLREAELWATTAAVRTGATYPYDTLDRMWKQVLLNQFHDILPGSSIAWVYREAERSHRRVAEEAESIIGAALSVLTGPGSTNLAANAGPFALGGVPALGVGAVDQSHGKVTCEETTDGWLLDNGFLRTRIDGRGLLVSIEDLETRRELLPADAPANLLQLFRDTPAQWDAWDIDDTYRRNGVDLTDCDEITVSDAGDDLNGDDCGPTLRVVRTFGSSKVVQDISLPASARSLDISTMVEWNEREKLLKLAFPFDVHAERAASEIQFGHVHRPTHANTPWDAARFETCAHRWVHVGEPDYGVAIANDGTYGHDIFRSSRSAGGITTTVRLSLLRSPQFPDPEADRGPHTFAVSVRPGASIATAIREGYRLNLPLRPVAGGGAVEPMFVVDDPALVIEAVKLAEDRSGDVVVRLYESLGTRVTAALRPHFGYSSVHQTDLLERPAPDPATLISMDDHGVRICARPFQVITLRFSRAPA